MAAAMLPDLLDTHIELAREYGLVPVLPRFIGFAPDPVAYARAVAMLQSTGKLLPDHFRGTLAVSPSEAPDAYQQMITSLPEGVTHIALHCTTPGEFEAIEPDHAAWRIQEYALLDEGRIDAWCKVAGITPVGYRDLQWLQR